jgi:flagellar biosynthetic protein FliR
VIIDLPTAAVMPFFLLLTRIGGLMIFAPFFGSGAMAPVIRVVLALSFTVALFPLLEADLPQPQDFNSLFFLLSGELVVGMLLGFVGRLFLASFEIAGQIIGFQMGFAVIKVIDPQTQSESPVMSILQNIIGILIFLTVNGHHWFVQAIVESYQIVGRQVGVEGAIQVQIVRSAGEMFVLGIKIAAPVVVVLLIVDILLGIVGRAAPQLHILVVGLPAKSLMGFIFLAAAIHTSIPFLGRHFNQLQRQLYVSLEALGR